MTNSTPIDKHEAQPTEPEASAPQEAKGGCCGGAAPEGADACCALDAEVKSTGGPGCGCAPKVAAAATARKGCC